MRFKPGHSALRLITSSLVGIVVVLVLPHSLMWPAKALLGWVAFCTANLLRLASFLPLSADQTQQLATTEDETRPVAASITTISALVSLVGVLLTLHQAAHLKGLGAYLLTGLAVLTVALSWMVIHAEYTIHYARRFYADEAGVMFLQPDTEKPLPNPNLMDFAYLSFTIGMTFQVSDTSLNTRAMRQLLLGHALLSYAFSAVIVAVTINALGSVLS